MIAHSAAFPALGEAVAGIEFEWESIQEKLVAYAMSGLGGLLSSTVTVIGAVTGGIFNFFMSVIFAVFLLGSKQRLRRQYDRILSAFVPEKRANRVNHVLSVAHKAFSGFIVGQSLNALILGVVTALGMLAFRMPYPIIVGVISGTTALIPIIGGYIGAIVGAFLVFTISPVQALWFLVFIVILQQISGNLIYPRLVGSSIGLPGLWVLFAVVIGGGLGGIGGMLAGVPVVATIYQLIGEQVKEKESAPPMQQIKAPPCP